MKIDRITRRAAAGAAIVCAMILIDEFVIDRDGVAPAIVWAQAEHTTTTAGTSLPETDFVTWGLRALVTILVAVIVPVYVVKYGWSNFLWFSDIALIGVFLALWLENPLLASTMAVGMLLPELLWAVSFLAGLLRGRSATTLAGYMFDRRIPRYLRSLSLFHFVLPPALIWLLYRYGYDERALCVQTAVAWVVLPASLLFAPPEKNVNWIRGFGHPPRRLTPLSVHVAIMMLGFPLLIYLPTHFVLRWLFG